MVFFWPTKKRLETMLFISAYEAMTRDVLAIDAKKLVQAERKNMRLSAINSGNARPMAFLRDLTLFETLQDYPFEERRRKYDKARAIAEVCVVERVQKIADMVIQVQTGTADEILAHLLLQPAVRKRNLAKNLMNFRVASAIQGR